MRVGKGGDVVGSGALFVAVFLACVVEAVEATTIVLAAGTARDWRSAMIGMAGGIALLAVIVAALGPAVSAVPLGGLRLGVGAVPLVFAPHWGPQGIPRARGPQTLTHRCKSFA